MNLFRRRTLILASGGLFAAALIAFLVHSFIFSVNAVDNAYTIHILEITDPTSASLTEVSAYPKSELDALQGLDNIKVDTMTMKRFVSLRDNWDGKYDAVYIGKGAFSKTLINSNSNSTQEERKAAHKSTNVQNDITGIKAKELIDYYISKGLNVFFREETFTQQDTAAKRGVLYASFNSYRTTPAPNVTFVKDLSALNTLTAAIKDGSWTKLATLKQRPRLTISNKPASYSGGSTTFYQSDETLNFSVKLDNVTDLEAKGARVKLYISVDSSLPVKEDNVVATKEFKTASDTISYKLPPTFSGPLYWRLEVSTLAGLKDFQTGNFLYKGTMPVIKVLQVMPAGKTSSNLQSTSNMKSDYLFKKDYYELQITSKDMTWFNNYIAEHTSTEDSTSGLNGAYDMIVFGFQDMYDRVSTPMLSEAAAKAVKAFAEKTKQSLMLTHDTIFRDSNAPYQESANNYNYWSPYFHDMVGQAQPRTYLGGNAIYPSTKVVSVNQGLLTQYPFNLDTAGSDASRYNVATTHDQFFPLDLNNPEVIPWYNINGSERDADDSYNHFYTYSIGNITFSGTGHTSTNFPDWEQRLFVNTMYRAFTGANHAPKITVYTPLDKSTKPSYHDKLTVSYLANDLDLKDKELITEIKIRKLVGNDEKTGTYVDVDSMPAKTVRSGDTVTQIFNNPLREGGKLQIEITAKDKQGALATELVNVTVEKVTANLTINRSLPSTTVEKGEPFTITYNVKPNIIQASAVDKGDQGVQNLVISDIQYSEVFPVRLEFSELAAQGLTQSGNAASGYTLTKNLGKLTYHLSQDGKTYIPDSADGINFSVTVTATDQTHYDLQNSKLSFEDLNSLQVTTATPVVSATASATASPTASPTATVAATQTPVPAQVVRTPPLGIARDFNVFILGDINRTGGIEGTVAGGGNVTISASGIASGIAGNAKERDALVVGGNLNFSNDSVNGNVIVGGTPTISQNGTILGDLKSGTPIDFTAEFKYLREQSDALANLPVNGVTKTFSWGEVSLKGTDPKTNVFSVNAADMKSTIGVDIPKGSTAVINITGSSVSLGNGSSSFAFCSDKDNSGNIDACKNNNFSDAELKAVSPHVIFNFNKAESLTLDRIRMDGTVLAPRASINFLQGNVYGTLIGTSLVGGGTPMNVKFNGETGLPVPTTAPVATPTPAPTATPAPSPTPMPAPVLARVTMSFDDLGFDAKVRVKSVSLADGTLRLNTELNMDALKTILPADASNPALKWESLNPGIATISESGTVLGIAPGTARIKLTVTDAFNTTFTATGYVTVVAPQLTISGFDKGTVGTPNIYTASYLTVNEDIQGYEWKIKPDSNTAGATLTVDPLKPLSDQVTLAASKSGTVVLTAVALTDKQPSGTRPEEKTITFTNPVAKIEILGVDAVNVGEEIELKINVTSPDNADPAEYSWSLDGDGSTYAKLTQGAPTDTAKLAGLKITDANQPVVVRASVIGTPEGQPITAILRVTVGTRLNGLLLRGPITLKVGEQMDLFDINRLGPSPSSILLKELTDKLSWSSSNPAVVLMENGVITGKVKGSAKVTVSYTEDSKIQSTIDVFVTNEDRY
ncbi:DUF5057 domain-containing protein [Paenibacillus sp. MMS20-IR301]|uniref:DUF5057 domain-containing protein n=1 Tax=Paenibacillus sp. MMS20-IR301 TaxID=2895946 RepID=UPI0028E3CF4F|nr:DUF5057 domain-containing protein [Paenibacillus sp. MMS20-IR301]WNS42689.1 DUF5057 domain-containing protein [Paenibacillus sp. MMS20-IR301]